MNTNKFKELANVFAPKDENGNDAHIDMRGSRHFIFLVIMVMGMGLCYVYNDVDYDLQIKHYYKSRETLVDRRYVYISDQQELNRAGMRSNVESKLAERRSRISAPKSKPILITHEETE